MKSQELSKKLVALRNSIAENEAVVSALKRDKDELEQLLIDSMDNEGLENFRTEDGTFTTYGDAYVSFGTEDVKEQNRATFFAWLREHDMGDVIKVKEDVHAQTIKRIVKDHGCDVPGIKATFVTKVKIIK